MRFTDLHLTYLLAGDVYECVTSWNNDDRSFVVVRRRQQQRQQQQQQQHRQPSYDDDISLTCLVRRLSC